MMKMNLILELSDKGLSNKEISDIMNLKGLKTFSGLEYTHKRVFGLLQKYKIRRDRVTDYYIDQFSEELYIEYDYD